MLAQLNSIVDTTTRDQLQCLQDEIGLLIAEDDYIDFAIEYSKLMLKDTETLFGLKLSEEKVDREELKNHPGQILQSVAEIIELLFELQPTLRAIRQGWCLQQECTPFPQAPMKNNQMFTIKPSSQALRHSQVAGKSNVKRRQTTKVEKNTLSSDINMQLLDIGTAVHLRDTETKQVKASALDKAVEECLNTPGPTTEKLSPMIQEAISIAASNLRYVPANS